MRAGTKEKLKVAIHFIIENGEWTVKLGEYLGQEKIDAELAFSSMEFGTLSAHY